MAATVQVVELNGTGPDETVITTGRYCTVDSYAPGIDFPCTIPASGEHYSYWKHQALKISGSFTQVDNIRWHTDGAINWNFGTNGQLRVGLRDAGDNGCPAGSYQQASGEEGINGVSLDDVDSGHAYYKGQATPYGNTASYTSDSPLTVDTSSYTDPDTSKAVVTQLIVSSDASQGEQADEIFVWLYDET